MLVGAGEGGGDLDERTFEGVGLAVFAVAVAVALPEVVVRRGAGVGGKCGDVSGDGDEPAGPVVAVSLIGDGDLPEVGGAFHGEGEVAAFLEGGQEDRQKHRGDGDDDEEFDECECLGLVVKHGAAWNFEER